MRFDSFHNEGAIESFLPFALLKEKMVAIRALHDALPGSCAPDALLGAAVAFELGHDWEYRNNGVTE